VLILDILDILDISWLASSVQCLFKIWFPSLGDSTNTSKLCLGTLTLENMKLDGVQDYA
jgi:hypothetical protein